LAIAESSPKTGILHVLTSGAQTDFVTYFGKSGMYWTNWAITIAWKGPKMSKQPTAGKRKHVILTIPHTLELSRTESGEN